MIDSAIIIALLDELAAAKERVKGPHPDLSLGEQLDLWRGYDNAVVNRFDVVAQAYRDLLATVQNNTPEPSAS